MRRSQSGTAVLLLVSIFGGCEYAEPKTDSRTTTTRSIENPSPSHQPTDVNPPGDPPLMTETAPGPHSSAVKSPNSNQFVTAKPKPNLSAPAESETFSADKPLKTVASIDIKRYMGDWYEIARYDSTFQSGIVGVIASYAIDGDIIRVKNSGFEETLEGAPSVSTAKGWVVEGSKNTKWEVQFIWPFTADYWIVDIGENYEYAVVGQPGREYLWILSRTPQLDSKVLNGILKRLRENGYDTSKLYYTPQPKK